VAGAAASVPTQPAWHGAIVAARAVTFKSSPVEGTDGPSEGHFRPRLDGTLALAISPASQAIHPPVNSGRIIQRGHVIVGEPPAKTRDPPSYEHWGLSTVYVVMGTRVSGPELGCGRKRNKNEGPNSPDDLERHYLEHNAADDTGDDAKNHRKTGSNLHTTCALPLGSHS